MIDLKTLATLTILSGSFGIASSDFLIEVYGKTFNKQLGKPLGCSFCMAFWCGLAYSLYQGYEIIDSVLIGCTSSIISVFIKRIFNL